MWFLCCIESTFQPRALDSLGHVRQHDASYRRDEFGEVAHEEDQSYLHQLLYREARARFLAEQSCSARECPHAHVCQLR
jgi:hypothetical protein